MDIDTWFCVCVCNSMFDCVNVRVFMYVRMFMHVCKCTLDNVGVYVLECLNM